MFVLLIFCFPTLVCKLVFDNFQEADPYADLLLEYCDPLIVLFFLLLEYWAPAPTSC